MLSWVLGMVMFIMDLTRFVSQRLILLKALASRARWKLLQEVQNVASRACCKIKDKVESVAYTSEIKFRVRHQERAGIPRLRYNRSTQ